MASTGIFLLNADTPAEIRPSPEDIATVMKESDLMDATVPCIDAEMIEKVKTLHAAGIRCFINSLVKSRKDVNVRICTKEEMLTLPRIKHDKQFHKYVRLYKMDHQIPVYVQAAESNRFLAVVIMQPWLTPEEMFSFIKT